MRPLPMDTGLNEALGFDANTIAKGRQLTKEQHDLKLKIAADQAKLIPHNELIRRWEWGYERIDDDVEGSIKVQKTLQKRIEEMERSLRKCQEALAPIEECFDASIRTYAQKSNKKFLTDLHTALPQELRDMIYAYLFSANALDRIGTQIRRQISDVCCETDGECPRTFDVPLFLHRDCAPLQVRNEILREAARQVLDKSHIIRTSRQLEKFAKTRAFHLDVPVSYFFNEIKIQLIFPKILIEWQQAAPSPFNESPMSEAAWAAFEIDFRKPIVAIPQGENQTFIFDILLWEKQLPQNSATRCRQMVENVLEDLKKRQLAKIVARWYDDRADWPYPEDRILLIRWETLRMAGADPSIIFCEE